MAHTEYLVTRTKQRPSWLDRVRSYWVGPITAKSPELAKYFGTTKSSSGMSVNEHTALTSSPVWSAVGLISDDIAALPLHLYRRDGRGKSRYEQHPTYRLLHDAPNAEMTSFVWRRTMQAHVLLWGNAYAEIERDGAGRPVAIWPLVPELVRVDRQSGRIVYRVRSEDGSREVVLKSADVVHLVGPSHNGSVGASLVEKARESFGLALAAEKFGGSFYGNGATFGGVVSFQGPRPQEMAEKAYRDQLESRHAGVERAYKMLALYNGAKFERMGTNPDEGQFIETRTFQIRETARWFKMPPHKLGDLADATYSNVEQMDAAYLSSCLRPWLKLWEQELSRKLIYASEARIQFIEHDTHGFLSVDAAARADLYGSEFGIGSVTPNEIRGYENRNPIEGGDLAFVPLNMMPLDMVAQHWELQFKEREAALEKMKQPPPAPATVVVDPSDEIKSLRDVTEGMRADLLARVAEAEAAAKRADDARIVAEQRLVDVSDARDAEEAAKVAARVYAHDAEAARVTAEADKGQAILAKEAAEERATAATAKAAEANLLAEEAQAARVQAEQARDEAIRQLRIVEDTLTRANETLEQYRSDLHEARTAAKALAHRTLVAHRALLADTLARVVDRETERARKHAWSAPKLHAWLETFYGSRGVDDVTAAVLPAVTAYCAVFPAAVDPMAMARQIAEDHVEQSARQLRAGMEVGDVERVLQSWALRPAATADRLLERGLADV